MWEGLTGKRRRYGLFGMTIGAVISAILIYLSFYIQLLYLLVPVILVVVFHYTKLWRFSDRAFYGLIAILLGFFIAMGGISANISGESSGSHEAVVALSVANVTYDINFSYQNVSGSYVFDFSMPIQNATDQANVVLLNEKGDTVLSDNVTFLSSNGNYSLSLNAGPLAPSLYVVNLTTHFTNGGGIVNKTAQFAGPVLISTTSIFLLFVGSPSYIEYLLLVPFLFYLAFAFFARAISSSQKRRRGGDQNPPIPSDQPVIESGQQKTGWFGRRRY